MRSIHRILSILLLSCFSFAAVQSQENVSYFLHTIEKGQSLYSISSMYSVSQSDIIRLNPGCENKIYAGQALKIPQNITAKPNEVFHTIQAGENLYRLTVQYSVSAKDICDENPGLSAENFKAGQVIRIPSPVQSQMEPTAVTEVLETPQIQPAVQPRCKEMHKVKRKETVFSVSREYRISERELMEANPELKDGMKKGQLLCIPYPKSTIKQPQTPIRISEDVLIPPTDDELFNKNRETSEKIPTIKAAVILPFLLNEERKGEAARMVEYYEGFLMAVDSLKRKGMSTDLYVYDSGGENKSIASILAKEELKKMDIIFGPLYQQHIKPLATFADQNNIRLVIPITSKDNEVFQNPHIYQINTPQSYLYSEVYEHFTRQFPNANVIILDMQTNEKDKKEFIQGLEQELNKSNIPVRTLNGTNLTAQSLKDALSMNKENIFIPTSGTNVTLIKITPFLKMLVKENPTTNIHLFGYPEWQTYTNDHLESFFELDTYFYSSFYTNNLLPAAINFTSSYRKLYSREMVNSYPKYGMLGFDTGFFFLSGLYKYGTGLEQKLDKINLTPIQTGFKFERVNNWGGFINKKIFFVRYTKDFELLKLDFD